MVLFNSIRIARELFYVKSRRKEMFSLMTQSTHLRLYGVRRMVKDHSDSERGNPLPPLHGLLFPIRSGQVRAFNVHIQSKLL